MKCWRLNLKHNAARYLSGELEPRKIKELEDHLLDCERCRGVIARVREGHRLATRLPREISERDSWMALEKALDFETAQSAPLLGPKARSKRILVWRWIPTAAAVIAIVFLSMVVFMNRDSTGERRHASLLADGFEDLDFHRVSISDIEHNKEPHIVAEGYVSEVRIDHEDGDLVFKLVDDVKQSQPFIVCEILNPKKLAPPRVGARVRVYGVSRYDNQENHNWYEVHPVLNIEVVR